ncbi:MAG: KEOPS complex subunit Pcc1 [Halanaeroarchaeum sp.]
MPEAIIRTAVDDPTTIAGAVTPDNTDAMATTTETDADGTGRVVTTIERETTGGLRSTLDDYLINCIVAVRTAQIAAEHANTQS